LRRSDPAATLKGPPRLLKVFAPPERTTDDERQTTQDGRDHAARAIFGPLPSVIRLLI
jgi:hypothetical protein